MLATAEDGLAQIADISLPDRPPAPAATDDARGSAIATGEDKAAQAAATGEESSAAPEADTSRDSRTHGGALPR